MPLPIPDERATDLRARINAAIEAGTHQPGDFARALAMSRFYQFRKGGAHSGISVASADKLDQLLNGKAPSTAPAMGPTGQRYASDDDTNHLRATLVSLCEELGSFRKVEAALGFSAGQLSQVFARTNSSRRLTLPMKVRVERAIEKREAKRTAAPSAGDFAKTRRTPAAKVHALRAHARVTLDEKFNGKRPEMARAGHMTTAALTRFLDGGGINSGDAPSILGLVAGFQATAIASPPVPKPRATSAGAPPSVVAICQKTIEKWGREAIALLFILAQQPTSEEG
jgi:hypothetical protein